MPRSGETYALYLSHHDRSSNCQIANLFSLRDIHQLTSISFAVYIGKVENHSISSVYFKRDFLLILAGFKANCKSGPKKRLFLTQRSHSIDSSNNQIRSLRFRFQTPNSFQTRPTKPVLPNQGGRFASGLSLGRSAV